MQRLRDQVKKYDEFPNDQEPLVFARPDHVAGPISMAPVVNIPESREGSVSKGTSMIGPEEKSFVDLRLFFTRDISPEDAKHVANMISPAVLSRNFEFNETHVSVLDQGKLVKLLKFRDHWRRARHSLGFLSHSRKRARTRRSQTLPQTLQSLDIGKRSARPITPFSDDSRYDADTNPIMHEQETEGNYTSPIDIASIVATYDSSDDKGP